MKRQWQKVTVKGARISVESHACMYPPAKEMEGTKRMEQGKIEDVVARILMQNPRCREDDFLLISEVYRKMVPSSMGLSFHRVCRTHDSLDAVSFESITRARRKCQADNPELMSREQVARYRAEREEAFREHYGSRKEI